MGGAGGGLVYNVEELRTVVNRGLQASLVHQCLIEESILGWEELELEVVRDAKNNMITICFIENIPDKGNKITVVITSLRKEKVWKKTYIACEKEPGS